MAFSNPVVGGLFGELIRAAIRSPNFLPGVSGWSINRDGSAEFNNVTIRLDLATGSIAVGPSGGPQVVIYSDGTSGIMEFPTNEAGELEAANIRSQSISPGTPNENEVLIIKSAETAPNDYAEIRLDSGDVDTNPAPSITMQLSGFPSSPIFALNDDGIQLGDVAVRPQGNELDELLVGTVAFRDGNYPARVVRGKKVNANTITTLPIGVDTEVATSDVTTAYLANGVAYEVEVNLSTRSSVGTSAAGTQVVAWKLWDGAVGGTQLGQSAQKTNGSVGTIANDDYFRFTFNYTGTSGSKTLRISGNKLSGADTFQAIMNTASSVIVKRIGDPAKITNL